MTNLRRQLEHHFREQQRFAEGYSPLYAHLFALVAGWLAGDAADPVVDWLIEVAAERPPFDVTLLLMAALHRDVLAGEPAAAELGRYYTTVGYRPPTADRRPTPERPSAVLLRATILARRDALGEFIRTANVQTNETGRGLVWLLPVACMGWDAVHLVELGASAGLNLVADRRVYRLADAAEPSRTLLQLGAGPPQFTTLVRAVGGDGRPRAEDDGRRTTDDKNGRAVVCGPSSVVPSPTILSRTGGDVRPFHLRDAADELTLAAYVWGDQAQRMARLREGIAALRAVESSADRSPLDRSPLDRSPLDRSPLVRLAPLNLPDGLPRFLADELPRPLDAPVVIYNTVVTLYLPDRGASLRGMVAEWAARQSVPVLWLQWEPWRDGPPPPEREWMAWTADYWPNDGRQGDSCRPDSCRPDSCRPDSCRPDSCRPDSCRPAPRSHLAWVHPHGAALEWVEGWPENLRKSI